MQPFLTPVLVIWFCRLRHLCCPLGDQLGHMFCHSETQLLLEPMRTLMTTFAALSVMILISLGALASVEMEGVRTCLSHLF